MRLSSIPLPVLTGLWFFGLMGCANGHSQQGPASSAATKITQPKITKPVPPTPINQKKAELGGTTWDPAWSQIIARALPADLLSRQVPRDVRQFCPAFYEMSDENKRVFWAYFFQALAGAEAGLDPQATVRHVEPKLARQQQVPAARVRTEGLLQLTYADQQRYNCPFDQQAEHGLPVDDPARTILQPKNNLTCGVMILENQIITKREPLLTRRSYWATLRPGTFSYRIFAKEMVNPPAACEKKPESADNITTRRHAAP